MLWKVLTLLGLVICARGERPATSEQMLKQEFVLQHGHHGELNHIGSHLPEHHEEYAWAYPSYEFSYTVNDPHTHDHKGQYEHRKGDEVRGEYWLLQPDGKKRTVKYEANKHKGFKAQVHYTEHNEHHEEPRIEEVIKPVVELAPEEPAKPVEESEPILVAEIPEAVVEERQEEREPEPEIELIEPVRQKPKHHKPIHIEYYINHKYRKHHHEEHEEQENQEKRAEPEEERREEEGTQGQEARIQESEEPRVEVKHRKPIHVEHYAKIHHPIHNEHHGHEIPKHSAPVSIIVRHDDREEKRGREEKHGRVEMHGREENRGREEKRGRDEKRGPLENHEQEEKQIRQEELGREEYRDRKEQRGYEEQRGYDKHREEFREQEGLRGWGEQLGREERYREEHRGRKENREREELNGWRENRGRDERERGHLPLVPLRREPYYGHRRYEHRDDHRNEPHDQLLRLHKPVIFRPENSHHHPRSVRQEKKA